MTPEGISVHVVPASEPVTEAMARLVAPTLARRLHPDRDLAGILHVEDLGDGSWEVVVQDHGPAEPTIIECAWQGCKRTGGFLPGQELPTVWLCWRHRDPEGAHQVDDRDVR